MSAHRQEIVAKILSEREKHFNLPGSEWDMQNSPNDWIAIVSSYLTSVANRKHTKPSADDFEAELIKAAAVILAALENIEGMSSSGKLS
jgi:hypothetical protein